MKFPQDRAVYANLNTSFTDFDALIADVTGRKTTGCVRLAFDDYEGILFLVEGSVVNAVEQSEAGKRTGSAAAAAIGERTRDKNGGIWVYQLAPELVELLVAGVDGEMLYRDLSTAFTSLDRLVGKMRSEGLSGYIEVLLADAHGTGMIFLKDGEPVEALLFNETQTSAGRNAVEAIVQAASTVGATFNVVRAGAAPTESSSNAIRDTVNSAELLAVWGEALGAIEAVVDRLAKKEGRFLLAFKEVLVARAPTYPFLDPFAGDFEYRRGVIRFEGTAPEDMSQGISDCLSDTIAKLAFQLRRADLETRIREELSDFATRRADAIERLDLGPALQEFVA